MPGNICTATVYDVMLMQHLRFPDLPHDLGFIGSQFSSKPSWKDNKESLERYCARDTDVTLQAFRQLRPMLMQEGLLDLYHNVQVPLAKICYLMRETGFTVDPGRIQFVRERLLRDMAAEEKLLPKELRTQKVPIRKRQPAPPGTLSEKTGKPIKFVMVDAEEEVTPWRSPTTVGAYLYETLKLPVQTHAKTGNVSTDKMALEKLYRKTKRREILAIQKLRKWDELVTTFCKEAMVDAVKQHPHFNVHGTASGRLSSSDPNLQNIPESARYIYVPSVPGWKIVECVRPDQRVLTADLHWKPAKELCIGEALVGFDEHGSRRKLRSSTILNNQRVRVPCYRIITTQGAVEVSDTHGFLVSRNGKPT